MRIVVMITVVMIAAFIEHLLHTQPNTIFTPRQLCGLGESLPVSPIVAVTKALVTEN